jgi:hypothetical protein
MQVILDSDEESETAESEPEDNARYQYLECRQFFYNYRQCCGFGMLIRDPNVFIPDPGSKDSELRIRILIKEFKYFFLPKKLFPSSRNYGPGCSSRILNPNHDFLPIQDPGVKKVSETLIRIMIFYPIPDPGSKGLKAPDPGSGSATLNRYRHCSLAAA